MRAAFKGLGVLAALVLGSGPVIAQSSSRASVASGGSEVLGESDAPAISADGRYVVFVSEAADLVPNDTNGDEDLFIHDRRTTVTSRVRVGPGGAEVDCECSAPAVSGNGRFVAFESFAASLVPSDTNASSDVFVHDRLTGITTRISVPASATQADRGSYAPSISGNGRFVAFASDARNLVPADANNASDIFIHDRDTGTTMLVSASNGGQAANGSSFSPLLSASGRYIAFTSLASNLVPDDSNGMADVFVRDLQAGHTIRISVDRSGLDADSHSVAGGISSDGNVVTVLSDATDLVSNDTNGTRDVFVYDRQPGRPASPGHW